jgi:UDP-glucuronate 4-epimerase
MIYLARRAMVPPQRRRINNGFMSVLVTGAAGFIGYHVSEALLARGDEVVGVDNMSPYYDVNLKRSRLERLQGHNGFRFHQIDIADWEAVQELREDSVRCIVHLAAQAGVRYSLENPFAYAHSNLVGYLSILELARALPKLDHLVYASSSSVYGKNEPPFTVGDRVDQPISLYGATKKSDELMTHCYSHLFGVPATGLRFFTAYGPWGRPDMAAFAFTRAILAGEPIRVYNDGDMRRDFTYIDDVVSGILAVLDGPPEAANGAPPYRLYNVGNNRPEDLLRYIELLEKAIDDRYFGRRRGSAPGRVPHPRVGHPRARHPRIRRGRRPAEDDGRGR